MGDVVKNLLIRRLKKEDSDDMSRIETAITKSPTKTDFRQIIEEQIRKEEEEASFVAEIDGKVVGYMISYIIYAAFGLDKSAWIAELGVDPRFMGQGIGKELAEEIFKFYSQRNIKHILTSVRWDSVDLLSFFKTLGFDRSHFINLSKELDS